MCKAYLESWILGEQTMSALFNIHLTLHNTELMNRKYLFMEDLVE